MWFFGYVIYGLIFGFACQHLAKEKGKDPGVWFLVGFFLGLVGLLIIGLSEKEVDKGETSSHSSISTDKQLDKIDIFKKKCSNIIENMDIKKCTECAENIKLEAKKCRYCGEPFTISELTDGEGNLYIGEISNNQKNGKGKMIYKDGITYIGEWKNNKYHGSGILTSLDGAKFIGEYQNGYKHGVGTYIFPSGDKFIGEYRNGQKYGWGLYRYANGEEYWGEWRLGEEHGKGILSWPDGRTKKGRWEYGKYINDRYNDESDNANEVKMINVSPEPQLTEKEQIQMELLRLQERLAKLESKDT